MSVSGAPAIVRSPRDSGSGRCGNTRHTSTTAAPTHSPTPCRITTGFVASASPVDSKKFLVVKQSANQVPPRGVVVQNWLEELKRLVPTP
jgi:hypothetical protein